MAIQYKILRFFGATAAVVWIISLPVIFIHSALSESLYETEILGDYKFDSNLRISYLNDQIIYAVKKDGFPWIILAVGDIKESELVTVFYSDEGFWAFILGVIIIFGFARWGYEYSLIGMFVNQNKKLDKAK